MSNTKKIVYLSILISQALVLHYIEAFFPPLAPGAKLGLANIITLITLMIFGYKEAILAVVIRSILGSLLVGNPTGIIYSTVGGLLSGVVMGLLYYRFNKYFSLIGISTAGAVFHNIGQLTVASIMFGTFGILFSYLPLLMVSAVITGGFIGIATRYISKYLRIKGLVSIDKME